MTPEAVVDAIERDTFVPSGPGDAFSGYGVIGLPLRSGHVLALRRFFATSLGPPYTSIWHRDPVGRWTFYSTVTPDCSCARYFGARIYRNVVTPIDLEWATPWTLQALRSLAEPAGDAVARPLGTTMLLSRVQHGQRWASPRDRPVRGDSTMSNPTPEPDADLTPRRHAAIAMDAATFRALGHQLVDQLATLMEAVPRGPVTRERTPTGVRQALGLTGPLPEDGEAAGPLLERTARLLFEQSLFNAHPRFFGYITASPAPIGVLGDFLASALNPNVGAWALSPAATEIESQAIRWIGSLIQYDTACGGIFVSGGNMANIVCFLAARAAKAPWNVREQGVAGSARQFRVYCSAETHTWIQKAADLSGLGTASIRWIPTDSTLRMDTELLRKRIDADLAAGDLPFLVVGTAGSVSTGAIDALPELRAICTTYGLWFHVDAAYGGFANALPDAPGDLRGLSSADSVAVDPHKWLYAPLEAGCALVRDAESLRAAFAYHPPYYHFGETATNFVDFGMQNSRGFRALKVWLALKQVGASGYRAMIADDIRLSQTLAHAVDRHPDLELISQNLSITVFRYVPATLRGRIGDAEAEQQLDAINREVLDRLQRGGEAFVSNAVVADRYALRACIVNYHTSDTDVNALPEIVARVGRGVTRR